jgi:hypothetical protein
MSVMTTPQTFDTTPQVSAPEPHDPIAGMGTLEQQAQRQRERATKTEATKPKTAFEVRSAAIQAQVSHGTIRKLGRRLREHGRPITDLLAKVEYFTKLIDDRLITFRQLRASQGGLQHQHGAEHRFVIVCYGPPLPATPSPYDPGPETCSPQEMRRLRMAPAGSFLQAVARYASDKTHLRSLTGGLLKSLIWGAPKEEVRSSWSHAEDLVNYALRLIGDKYGSLNALDEFEPQTVMLRTLRPDHKSGDWPAYRTCRAILHKNYRDDISHQWLMRLLARLVPTGVTERGFFDGDLLKGAVLMPSISRTERDSDYGGGLFFFSGEIGNRRCGVLPFIYRALTRGITLFAADAWGVTHAGKVDLDNLEGKLTKFVHTQIPLVTAHLDRLLALQHIQFKEDDSLTIERLLIAIGSSYRSFFSNQDLRLWQIGVATERNMVAGLALSAFTLQNGLTRMSQAIEDTVRQIQLEQVAGDILDLDWAAIVARASTVSDDQVRKIFPE